MSVRAQWEYLGAIHARYQHAARQAKGQILDEFCATTGYHRKSAPRLPHGPPRGRTPPGGVAGRSRMGPGDPGADHDLGGRGLSLVGAAVGRAPRVAALGPAPLRLSATGCRQLRSVSPRQIDRRRAPAKRRLRTRRYWRRRALGRLAQGAGDHAEADNLTCSGRSTPSRPSSPDSRSNGATSTWPCWLGLAATGTAPRRTSRKLGRSSTRCACRLMWTALSISRLS
jgi:hypothetical protein